MPSRRRRASVEPLNQILADTMVLRDMYKKHHWQVAGPIFYQFHLLFEKHCEERVALVDQLAERGQTLGGVSIAMARDVAEATLISLAAARRRASVGPAVAAAGGARVIIKAVRQAARTTGDNDDQGTNDLLVSDVPRANEMQGRFLYEHRVGANLVEAK